MARVTIIAEAGINHNGNIETAMQLIDVAKQAGADIVKFQTGIPKNVMSKYAKKAEYQIVNTNNAEESQLEMANSFFLEYEDFLVLKEYAENKGIQFLSTPFDIESATYLHNIGMDIWKIPSGEITNYPYLIHIAKFRQPIIMSTGMCTMDEVKNAVSVLKEYGSGEITLLHCTTNYPTQFEDVNLNAMLQLKTAFRCSVGYSDHTLGIEVPIAAVAMGAVVIEKHFTLDKNMVGPDHKASLEPDELKMMVRNIRNIEIAMGDGIKVPKKSEIPNINVARKSIVAKRNILKNEILTVENLTTKRPGNGISPMKWDEILGTRAIRDFEEDELIEL